MTSLCSSRRLSSPSFRLHFSYCSLRLEFRFCGKGRHEFEEEVCINSNWYEAFDTETGLKLIKMQVTSALYASLQFCLLIEYCTIAQVKTKASIASATLTLVAAILLCVTSLLEHTRSPAPSFLLSIYLLITTLLDTVRIRTLWQIGESTALCSAFVVAFAVKLALLVAESWSKRRYLSQKDNEVAGEELAGFLSKSLFLWLNPLLLKGFGNWLTLPDLSPIDSAFSSTRLAGRFEGVTYTHYGGFSIYSRAS